jgi:hypothetical protein
VIGTGRQVARQILFSIRRRVAVVLANRALRNEAGESRALISILRSTFLQSSAVVTGTPSGIACSAFVQSVMTLLLLYTIRDSVTIQAI